MRARLHPFSWLTIACLAATASAQSLNCEAAAAFSADNAGLAVVVFDDGELVFEDYQNGHRKDKAQHIFSGTKSFVPVVALIAQDEGLLDLDEKVADTITEWQGDEQRERITIRHLLNFTSGLEHIDRDLHSNRTPDKYAAAIACKATSTPGKRFRYGSNHLMVFGELFQRKLRAASTKKAPLPEDFVAYLEARVLEPIECEYASWMRDREGNPLLPYGAYMTALEWARFGLLLQGNGKWDGKQLIPTEHFADCFEGTKANPIYGLNFWLVGKRAHRRDQRIPADTYSAAGMFDQKLYVVPSQKLVIVRLGRTGARTDFGDLGFLGALFSPADSKGKRRKQRK